MHRVNRTRRQTLKAGLAMASLFLPLPYSWVLAQSEGAVKLVRAPKVALVLGNSNYRSAAALRNPVNDANAIAEVLKGFGFNVTLKRDGSRAEMEAAIADHTLRIAQLRGVGVFYYAGHGLQLSWTNFLVPVDAVVRKAEDVQAGCVDLSGLMSGLRKAANPMNIVILDACRENPFARDFRVTNKGLTQMDAPNDTLLAYATAPGNVASDGDGANGLYTESLIDEIRAPETRIEDIFKRVRLNVRRKTGGVQVPWESTSLEEDFWFVPPRQLVQIAEERTRQEADERARAEAVRQAEAAQKFRDDLARWESIKSSRNAGDFYAFLLDRPSGYLAEQAQFRLDQLEKGIVQAQPGQSGIRPLVSGTNRYARGDAFTYDQTDRLKNVTTRFVQRVTYADDDRVEFNGGAAVYDQMGSVLRDRFGTKNPGILKVPADIAVGKRWRTAFTNTGPDGVAVTFYYDFRVDALEEVRVPAGEFRAFRLVGNGESSTPNRQLALYSATWVDPTTMLPIRWDLRYERPTGPRVLRVTEDSSTQLVSLTRARR